MKNYDENTEGMPRTLHESTFEYLEPTPAQIARMGAVRKAAKDFADVLDGIVPHGADKTYLLRRLREIAMWANVAITRYEDGSPREARLRNMTHVGDEKHG